MCRGAGQRAGPSCLALLPTPTLSPPPRPAVLLGVGLPVWHRGQDAGRAPGQGGGAHQGRAHQGGGQGRVSCARVPPRGAPCACAGPPHGAARRVCAAAAPARAAPLAPTLVEAARAPRPRDCRARSMPLRQSLMAPPPVRSAQAAAAAAAALLPPLTTPTLRWCLCRSALQSHCPSWGWVTAFHPARRAPLPPTTQRRPCRAAGNWCTVQIPPPAIRASRPPACRAAAP